MKETTILVTVIAALIVSAIGVMYWATYSNSAKDQEKITAKVGGLTVVEIEGCEYFKTYSYSGFVHYSHKGNCKNRIHK